MFVKTKNRIKWLKFCFRKQCEKQYHSGELTNYQWLTEIPYSIALKPVFTQTLGSFILTSQYAKVFKKMSIQPMLGEIQATRGKFDDAPM